MQLRQFLAWVLRIGGLSIIAMPTYRYVHVFRDLRRTIVPIAPLSAEQVHLIVILVVASIIIGSTWYVARYLYGEDVLRAARALEGS